MRSDANTSTTGVLRVLNNSGLFVGASNAASITQSGNDALVGAAISTGNLTITANVGGTVYNVARALGSNGTFAIANAATVGTTLSVTGNVTGGNVLSGGIVSSTGNITGGNVAATLISGTTLSATANVQGGNLRTTGLISATGNISTDGNVAGTYFSGNGSQQKSMYQLHFHQC